MRMAFAALRTAARSTTFVPACCAPLHGSHALHACLSCFLPCQVEPVVSAQDLAHTLDLLAKLATRVSGGNAVLQLVEEARRVSM